MRLVLRALTVLALASAATAQVQCGLAGVTATVSPLQAPPGVPIQVTLTNNTNTTIQLPSSCVFGSVHPNGDCSQPAIWGAFCLSVITPIAPGGSKSMTWFQDDFGGVQVPDGTYAFELRYWDSSFSVMSTCCPTVTIASDPGTPYCFGGGPAMLCPCGNDPMGLFGCVNSSGLGAKLSGTGIAQVGNDTVVLTASQCPANTPGLFFSGPTQMNLVFGDGLRCVASPVRRLGVVTTNTGGSASTPWVLSVKEGLAPGDLRHYQYWFRDVPGPCGSGFNLSNGYTIQW
ncbi:MAG: hypothetical protein H6828_10805 [Planctomycetes bacterium]|nr:hypothetical protein [Planctomycetota bacterium]